MEFLNCAPVSQLRQQAVEPKVEIYPNPVHKDLYVNIRIPEDGIINIKLTDASGSMVSKTSMEGIAGINDLKLDLSPVNSGLYLLELISGPYRFTRKVVKY